MQQLVVHKQNCTLVIYLLPMLLTAQKVKELCNFYGREKKRA